MKFTKILSMSLIALSITACGGSSGSDSKTPDSSGSTNTGGSGSSYVAGTFKKSVNTGEFYIKSDPGAPYVEQEFGSMARDCVSVNNDYYFETDRVMVFGSQSLNEDDFKKVATKVENNLDATLSSMGTNFSEFMSGRLSLALFASRNSITGIQLMDIDGKPDFTKMTDNEIATWSFAYFDSMSTSEQVAFSIEAGRALGKDYTEQQVLYKEKIYVCMDESSSTTVLGEGNRLGLSVAVPGLFNIGAQDELVKHELVHTVQQGIIHSFNGNMLPKWFLEGQAVYLSGQPIASQSEHNEVNVPYFVSVFDDAGTDSGVQYRHYGMAYKYLQDSNGIKKMVDFLRAINDGEYIYAQKQLPVGYNFDLNRGATVESTAFIVAFDEMMMIKKNGQSLIMNDWKYNYHNIMSE